MTGPLVFVISMTLIAAAIITLGALSRAGAKQYEEINFRQEESA